jgi:hypothetical protein
MLLTLLVCIYITGVCFAWGDVFIQLIGRKAAANNNASLYSWPVTCLTGLALIGTLAYWLSVFMPMGLTAHACILVPALLYYASPKRARRLYNCFVGHSGAHRLTYILLFSLCALLVFVISSHEVIHPDTVMYHAPSIKWMETYKAVPGIVNIDRRLGYQSWWFAVQALFRFDFVWPNSFLFINSCVACWFLAFVTERIAYWLNREKQSFFLWTALLAISLLCWTQVRLTAASASPDFIAAMYIWAAFYLFSKREGHDAVLNILIVTLSYAAISVKLSSVFIALLPVCLFFILPKAGRYKAFIQWGLISLLLIAPCLVRNVINTGYPLYPSPALNFFNPDWKAPLSRVQRESNYIEAYARVPFENFGDADKLIQQPISQWLPAWWHNQALTDQVLLLAILALLAWNLLTLPQQLRRRGYTSLVILFISLAGSCFWFLTAPDPRFGTGFLVALLGSVYSGFAPATRLTAAMPTRVLKGIVAGVGLLIFAYTVYRIVYFFHPRQLIVPAGIAQPVYEQTGQQGATIYLTDSPNGCGFSPVPCFNGPPPPVILRGSTISEGFKSSPK